MCDGAKERSVTTWRTTKTPVAGPALTDVDKPLRTLAKQQQHNPITLRGSRRRGAPLGEGQITEKTVYTVCPHQEYDARIQCGPGEKVDGAGFVAEWRHLRRTGK
jgi:hypothetical protein